MPWRRTLRHRPKPGRALNAELAKFASDGTVLKLMVQPAAGASAAATRRFYFVASAPPIRADEVRPELDELRHRGILQRLSDACMWDASDEIRYRQPGGTVELLTSIIPIKTVARLLGADLDPHHLGVPQHLDRPSLLGDARGAGGRGHLPRARDPRHAGRGQHLPQPAPLPRGRRRDQPGPHRRLRLLPAQRRARAVERGARLRQAGARPQAPVRSRSASRPRTTRIPSRRRSPPSSRRCRRCAARARRGPARPARARDHRIPPSPACSTW